MELVVPQREGAVVDWEQTGQLDPRFALWRHFCSNHGIAIDSLPSELGGAAKKQWERLKADRRGGK